MSDCWKEVWKKKGEKLTSDLKWLDGFENTNINPSDVSKKIIDVLDIKQNDKVLEVGCGAGMLARHIAPNCEYYGIDMTASLLKKHMSILKNYVLEAEANDIPFKDDFFDKCFSFSVFHYFPDKKYVGKAVSEMERVTNFWTDKRHIFIGDLPTKSKDKSHLLFESKDFKDWEVYDGFYTKDRFNVGI